MDFHLSIGWWLLPLAITICLFAAHRMYGPRMAPGGGHMFPDALGAFFELGGYLLAALVSVIAWLVWALL
jgi:hypothetical protein